MNDSLDARVLRMRKPRATTTILRRLALTMVMLGGLASIAAGFMACGTVIWATGQAFGYWV